MWHKSFVCLYFAVLLRIGCNPLVNPLIYVCLLTPLPYRGRLINLFYYRQRENDIPSFSFAFFVNISPLLGPVLQGFAEFIFSQVLPSIMRGCFQSGFNLSDAQVWKREEECMREANWNALCYSVLRWGYENRTAKKEWRKELNRKIGIDFMRNVYKEIYSIALLIILFR